MLLVHGDSAGLGDHVRPSSVELAYLDPPFSVGAQFTARTKKGEARGRETVNGASPVAYDDRWPSVASYLDWLLVRIALVRTALSDAGTMWLHLDQRAVHEAKALCDRVFGARAFIGEVIWAPGNGSKSKRGPGMSHQTLLLYAKTGDFVWNAKHPSLRAPFAKTSVAMHFQSKDETGRAFRDRTVNGKTYRYYEDLGRAIGSVWTDCPAMIANTPLHKEGTGYPTQKPQKLLERIVCASSSPGGLVLDPFCGSGTTLSAAAVHGRDAVGFDIGDLAIDITAKRLRAMKIPLEVRRPSSQGTEANDRR